MQAEGGSGTVGVAEGERSPWGQEEEEEGEREVCSVLRSQVEKDCEQSLDLVFG